MSTTTGTAAASGAKAGFCGLDLYSLYRAVHEVISYLEWVDPAAAACARERYACFDHFSRDDAQVYGFAAAFGAGESLLQALPRSRCRRCGRPAAGAGVCPA